MITTIYSPFCFFSHYNAFNGCNEGSKVAKKIEVIVAYKLIRLPDVRT